MLIELRVENHRSIRDDQALTMEAGRVGDSDDPRPREVPGHATKLLTAAGLYGANASGKSNVLSALGFMRDAVVHSHRSWPPEGGVPRDPFAWGPKAAEPSMFEVTLLLSGVRYQYGFVADDERFLEEWLYAWPKGRKQTWFERERTGDRDSYKFGEHLQGENRPVEQVTRSNALFLSAAVQHRHEQLMPPYEWFAGTSSINLDERLRRAGQLLGDRLLLRALTTLPGSMRQLSLFGDDDVPRGVALDEILGLVRAADVGVVDIKISSDDDDVPNRGRAPTGRRRMFVRHRSASGEAWLPFEDESQGTRTLLRMAPAILHKLQRGGLLIVDELESSLHPLLALQVVRQFNDPRTNPNNAQLLFTTHDTHLLGTTAGDAPLRRDQVWLTEKDNDGATVVYPLTDYKPRKAENLERGYLQGRYGAIPFLGDLARVEDEPR